MPKTKSELKAKYTKMSSVAILKMGTKGTMKLKDARIAGAIIERRFSLPQKATN